jgi:hypothetical protein
MRWPDGMEPERAAVHARNELIIPADPGRIWRWLCRASKWSDWYSNCGWVRFPRGGGPDLGPGASFVWKTFGVRVRSAVVIFEPHTEIGWTATAFGLSAYHGWTLEPLAEGCRVVTEGSHNGPLSAMGRWYLRRVLLREHQNWLESLRAMAIAGDPG